MIARIWHGVTPASKADAYLNLLYRTGVPDYRGVQGNQGVYILRRMEGDKAHFLTLTFWDSLDSVRGFAGDDFEKAKYYQEDREYLLEFEPNVTHYEVFVSSAE